MRSRKISWLISVLLSALFVLALALQIAAPKRAILLAPESIGHLQGNGYAFVIPKPYGWPILRTGGDTYDARYSKLVLLEDGKALSNPHAAMPAIENIGRGQFLHLRETELYFSASDNSDPRSNGRKYLALTTATPFPGLIDTLFVATIVAWAFVLVSRDTGRLIRFRRWTIPAVIGFAAIALLWQVLILGPIPRIVMSADAGLVSSIVAANLHPAKFATDYVFSDPGNFAFYWTLLIPLVAGTGHIIGDIGTAWGLLAAPLLFLQMLGFFLLGRRLFGRTGWPVALALISIPPVYVFGGELWGNLAEPLTRSTFNALFPYIVLLSLPPARTWRKLAAMALCGFGVYLHPVSAPGVAMAVWFALLFFKPEKESWIFHGITSIAAGFVFVAIATPFAISFAHSFPINPNSDAAVLSRTLLRTGAGLQYQNAGTALEMFFAGGVNNPHGGWSWRWIMWAAAFAAFFVLPKHTDTQTATRLRFLGTLSIGIVLASVGVSAADQAIAHIRQRDPLQLDLIRNLRFIIPMLLTGAVAFLAWLAGLPTRSKIMPAAVTACGVFLVLQWWLVYPTPISAIALRVLDGRLNDVNGIADGQRVIHSLVATADGSRVLILPATPSDESTELIGLAVRYAALKPVVFLTKDLNFLSYSSSSEIIDWQREKEELTALAQASSSEASTRLAQVIADKSITFILARTDALSPHLVSVIDGQAKPVTHDGTWQLWRVAGH